MDFMKLFAQHSYLFYDGPMETRIEYGTHLKLDKEMSIFRLLGHAEGRAALAHLYRTDIEVIASSKVPLILNAPTFRASAAHCQRLGIADSTQAITDINAHAIEFVKAIRAEYPKEIAELLVVTAPVGPKYAGFTPDLVHNLDQETAYHQVQINSLHASEVDLISIAAMPGSVETLGAALAASPTGLPYTVGFVVTASGTLLDGTPLVEVIEAIDQQTTCRPLGYIIACTHPSIAQQALANPHPSHQRIIGIKANGSAKPSTELVKLTRPEADDPNLFASELLTLGQAYNFKIYGGCCGTDHRHLQALVTQLSQPAHA